MTDVRGASLRAILLGGDDEIPELGLLLPRGWAATTNVSGVDDEIERMLAAFPHEQRASLRATFAPMLRDARSSDAGHVLLATIAQEATTEAPVPLTITVSCVTAPAGSDVAGLAASATRQHGARPLDPEGTILRWSEEQDVALEGGAATFLSVVHLLRVPRDPRRSLLLRTMILRSADGATVPEEGIVAMAALSDGIAASVRWRRHA